MTLEEDFALLLDFAELLEDFALLLDTLVSLLLDFGVTLEEEDFVLLLDFALLLDTLVSLTLDFGVTLEEEDFADSLDFGVTLLEDFADSLDFGVSLEEDSSSMLEEESSPGRTKLLSSSSQAARTRNRQANAVVNTNLFIYPPKGQSNNRPSLHKNNNFLYHKKRCL